jgi:phosphate starvation-inducible PhoH-like protein
LWEDNLVKSQVVIPSGHEGNILGPFDKYLKKLENVFHVDIINRGDGLNIIGEEKSVSLTVGVLNTLIEKSLGDNIIDDQVVDYIMELSKEGSDEDISALDKDIISYTVSGKPIKPKTHGQKKYVDSIKKNIITFGIGPAGTGKTYLAMAMAINAFKNEEVERIILTRPAIEAGEKLGFLPGDLQSKIDPYLRPLYDALYQIMGADSFIKNSEKGLIEVAPLAYMRGRTLDNSFIILDEAQNTMPAQMKMFLTRIGFGSKVVVTGDNTQKDLPSGQISGLDVAIKVVENIEDIAICKLTSKDVVRHPLVQKIVNAYEKYEAKNSYKENRGKKFTDKNRKHR